MAGIKRTLIQVDSVDPEFSPHVKHAKIEYTADFIKTRFRLRDGARTDKSRLREVVIQEYDSKATIHLVGRAVAKAFGNRIFDRSRKRRNCDIYLNIQEYRQGSIAQNPHQPPPRAQAIGNPRLTSTTPPSTTTPSVRSSPSRIPLPARLPHPQPVRQASRIPLPSRLPHPQPVGQPSTLLQGLSIPPQASSAPGHRQPPQLHTPRLPTIQTHTQQQSAHSTKTVFLSMKEAKLVDSCRKAEQPHTIPLFVDREEERFIVDMLRGRKPPHNVAMLVSVKEARALQKLRADESGALKYMIDTKVYERLETRIVEHCTYMIQREVMFYTQSSDCLMKRSSAADMESFSIQSLWDEFQGTVPTLTEIIRGACARRDQANMTQKTIQSITPAITSVIGKCLGIYSRKLSALRTFYSLMLSHGGVLDTTMNRLARLYDCTTHQSLQPKLNELAKRYNLDLMEWIKQNKEFAIVFDNVDVFTKPRSASASKSNTMFHMVQAIAVKERVEATGSDLGPPHITVENIKPADVIPSEGDYSNLKGLMVNEVLKIWSEIPGLQKVKMPMKSEKHKYTHMMNKKSEMVNLGVIMKNENIKEELLVCLREYHNLVPVKDGSPEHKLCIGDYLSFERGQQVISSQSDRKTSSERLEGLLMGMADFHVQMNFLKMGFKILFHGDTQPSVGSLAHAKDFLNAKNVVSDPCKRYYDCGGFFDKVFKSYINTAALDELCMKSLEDDRSDIDPGAVKEAAERVVAKFVDLSFPDLDATDKIRCLYCKKKYTNAKNLRKHHLSDHPDKPLAVDGQDSIFTYSCALITIGLLRSIHNRAIQLGNGPTIILLYKFMYLMFKANGSYKYGCGILETIIQYNVLPKPLSKRLVWNRFYNSYCRPDTNIPLDLQLEHENRMFKVLLKSYRGIYTQAHLDRISKGRKKITDIIRALDRELGYYGSRMGTKAQLAKSDIKLLTELYSTSNLMQQSGPRVHSPSTFNVTKNISEGMNGKSLKEWLTERMELCRIRNYYRQFGNQPATHDPESSLDICPDSDWSALDGTMDDISAVY